MLTNFKEYLIQKSLVKEKYILFYLKWVSDCYSFLNESDSRILSQEQKQSFLKYLSKTHQDWQIKQADNALRLYSYFLSSEKTVLSQNLSDSEKEWQSLEAKTKNALRLKHRSYSTEKTYLIWLRTFGDFVKKKTVSQLTAENIQNFLKLACC